MTISPELVAELAARYRLPAARARLRQLRARAATCPRVLRPPRPLDGPPRLVYQGTLSTNGGHYDLRDLFAAIAAQGLSLDVYPAREVPEYREIPGIRVHDTLPLADLLHELGRYDFGWAGFNSGLNGAHLDTALPNKLYEYLGCGLPVITLRTGRCGGCCATRAWGSRSTTCRSWRRRWPSVDVAALRRRVAERRERYTVEAQIARIAALYREVTAAGAASSGQRQRRLGRGRVRGRPA